MVPSFWKKKCTKSVEMNALKLVTVVVFVLINVNNSVNISKLKFQGSRGPGGEDGEIGKPGATVFKTKFLSSARCQRTLD